MGSLYFLFMSPFVFTCGGFSGVGGVIMTGLNHDKNLSALSGPLFSPSELARSQTTSLPYFRQKYWPASARPHVSLHQFIQLVMIVQGFKNYPIQATAFVMAYVADMKGIFLIVEKFDSVLWSLCSCLWDLNLVCVISILNGSNIKLGIPWNVHDLRFTGFSWTVILHPGGSIVVLLK